MRCLPLFLLLFTHLATAAGLTATVDRTQVAINDPIRLELQVEGTDSARPVLPPLSDFQVRSAGTSTQVTIINGKQTLSISHSYVLFPKRKGSFTIGAASIAIDGTTYTSRPISITVLPAEAVPAAADRDVFITTKVSNDSPYIGEPIVYTFRLYTRTQTGSASLTEPDWTGFAVQDLGKQKNYETVVNGQAYRVTELKRSMVPQDVGSFTFDPVALQIEVLRRRQRRSRSMFDDVFGGRHTRENRTLKAKALTIDVRPLPKPPPNYSGLVGQFRLNATISRQALKVGESNTVTVTVSGQGNVGSIPEPLVKGLERFKVYDDKPTTRIDTSGKTLSGSKVFTKSLVPLAPGELMVGPIELVVFDSTKERYRTLRQGPFPITVSPGDGKEDLRLTEAMGSQGKVAVRVLGDDILPIYRRLDAVDERRSFRSWTVAGALVLPPFAFLGLWFSAKRRERYAGNADLRRRQAANKVAAKYVADVTAAVGKNDLRQAAEAASRGLRGFIGDKLGLEGGALTPDEAEQRLIDAGVEGELAHTVGERLRSLEALQYGGASDSLDRLAGELENLISALAKALKARRRR